MRAQSIARHAAAIATAWFVVNTLPNRSTPVSPTLTSSLLRAAAQDCGCPPMPVVATSKEPAKGRVNYEMTVADIETLFSNRHAMFAGGWDDGMVALAHDLDPAGAWKIWDRPRPAANPRIPLEEGTLSRILLNPSTEARPDPVAPLIFTLARINKYGEPEQDLRRAVLSVLRFLADDLANVPAEAAGANPRALALSAVAFNARGTINGYVANAGPASLERRLKRGGPAPLLVDSDRAQLKVDALDLANAALDVYWALDDQKHDHVMRLHDDDRSYIVRNLVSIASARSNFGGTLVAGVAQDSVACRAYSTLATFADTRMVDSRPARDELLTMMTLLSTGFGFPGEKPAEFNAARAALLRAGIGDQAEADETVRTLFDQALSSKAAELELMTTLRALPLYAGGPDRDTFRGYMGTQIKERMDRFQSRQDVGQGGAEEQRVIDLWKASEGRVALANPSPPCGPDPGESKGRIFLYAVCIDGLQVIEELYVGVSTVVEVQFDAESEKKEVPIEISIGGQTLKLTAKRYDDHGRIFRTDPIVPGGKNAAKDQQ